MQPESYKLYGSLGQNGVIESLADREEKVNQLAEDAALKKKKEEEKAKQLAKDVETARRMNELKKKQEEEKAKRLAKDRENKKNNFKYS